MPSNPEQNARRRIRHAGDRLLTVVGDWTAPGPDERPGWSESSMSALVRTVTAVAGLIFLLAMFVIWLLR